MRVRLSFLTYYILPMCICLGRVWLHVTGTASASNWRNDASFHFASLEHVMLDEP